MDQAFRIAGDRAASRRCDASGKADDIRSLAIKHKLSEKTVRSTLSLAFLAPDIVQAAIDGKLPRGLGISSMTDLPADWVQQRRQLGIG